jgi:hypothetical protein
MNGRRIIAIAIVGMSIVSVSGLGRAGQPPCITSAGSNTACGSYVLQNATGDSNSGFGLAALEFDTTGFLNTAAGKDRMRRAGAAP